MSGPAGGLDQAADRVGGAAQIAVVGADRRDAQELADALQVRVEVAVDRGVGVGAGICLIVYCTFATRNGAPAEMMAIFPAFQPVHNSFTLITSVSSI